MNCNYNASSTQFLRDMMQGDMKAVYDPFLERMPERGIILDAGCGSGRDCLYFKELGHWVIPMDTSEQICQMAGEQIGQAVLFCRFQDVHFKVPFDGIWACGSLIHLESEELQRVLKHLYWYLKPTGVLYTSFIYGDSERRENGEFYYDLNEERAEKLFTDMGYHIAKMWITEDQNSDSVNIKWLNILSERKH